MNPKISVIVPVYDTEKFLSRCVDSILSQSFIDFELLLIDDGSKDTSPQICDEYSKKDSRVIVFHKANGGVSSARNLGLDNARGEWICFIDSDDYISQDYFSAIVNCKSDIVVFRNNRFRIDGNVYSYNEIQSHGSTNYKEYRIILKNNLKNHLFRVIWAKIMRKKCIGDVRFKLSQSIGEDTVFMYRIFAQSDSISIRNDITYFWQYDDSCGDEIKYSLSSQNAALFASNIYKAYKELELPSIEVESFLINYFFGLVRDKNNYCKWFSHNDVRTMNINILNTNPYLCSKDYWSFSNCFHITQYLFKLKFLVSNIKAMFCRYFYKCSRYLGTVVKRVSVYMKTQNW